MHNNEADATRAAAPAFFFCPRRCALAIKRALHANKGCPLQRENFRWRDIGTCCSLPLSTYLPAYLPAYLPTYLLSGDPARHVIFRETVNSQEAPYRGVIYWESGKIWCNSRRKQGYTRGYFFDSFFGWGQSVIYGCL